MHRLRYDVHFLHSLRRRQQAIFTTFIMYVLGKEREYGLTTQPHSLNTSVPFSAVLECPRPLLAVVGEI